MLNQFMKSVVSQQQSHNNAQASWQNYAPNPQTHLQMQQPHMQNQQVPHTRTQGAVTQNIMHTNLTADKNWHKPNQHILHYEQRYHQDANVNNK